MTGRTELCISLAQLSALLTTWPWEGPSLGGYAQSDTLGEAMVLSQGPAALSCSATSEYLVL
jgi:hypothetical protein